MEQIKPESMINFFNLITKGILQGIGSGSEYFKRTFAIETNLHPEKGDKYLEKEIMNSLRGKIENGNLIVFPAKIFAISQKRLLPASFIETYGKTTRLKKNEVNKLIKKAKERYDMKIDELDIIASDKSYVKNGFCSLLPENPNKTAFDISSKIKKHLGKIVDVLITDSANVLACRQFSISGVPAIPAIPIGATAGMEIHQCIRSTIAAEIARNKKTNTPIVVIKAEKGFKREEPKIGKFKYNGRLDIKKEKNVMDFLNDIYQYFNDYYENR